MKKENNSTIVFEVRLWNPNYYTDKKVTRKDKTNLYNGMLRVKGYTATIPFHTPGDLLSLIEKYYFQIGKPKCKHVFELNQDRYVQCKKCKTIFDHPTDIEEVKE